MGELVVFSDLVCPRATVIVLRPRAARARAGGEDTPVIWRRRCRSSSSTRTRSRIPVHLDAARDPRTSWIGGRLPRGTPVLEADEPAIYDRIVADALGLVVAGARSLAT